MDREEALTLLRGGPEGIQKWNHLRPSQFTLKGADLQNVNFVYPEVHQLGGVNLDVVDLQGANLRNATLQFACLTLANLEGANLQGADISWANLTATNLRGANLRGTILQETLFHATILAEVDLEDAHCVGTLFCEVDLSESEGLDAIRHSSPSTISIGTLLHSKGAIPERFLRNCGVPNSLIENMQTLIGSIPPSQFYSCFISYSTVDEGFASRLHSDFKAAGIPCWKWTHDARTGRPLWGEIDKAIRIHDKLVLIASESSLQSPAVNREVERAILQEDERAKTVSSKGKVDTDVLFPVMIDDYIFKKWEHERKADVTKKVIADARGWDADAAIYARVRDRLIRDLKAAD